ncbi:GDSL-type esterase/lipase family protein [Terribacillus saccharophilus]|uniref:GDSL-type esterase/lipase family protein n=1 Tax=Terribacillus saccharophilus TaxID=361277 RepID=UPI000BA7C842|nr:GDSL-type esterase/lipase family protein [Terribacillus saccharophilus]PAF19762.1 hypothetical protein CHH51_01485 [Terribacillus saccharophilus]
MRKLFVYSVVLNVALVLVFGFIVWKNGGLSFIKETFSTFAESDSQEYEPYYYDRVSTFEQNKNLINRESVVMLGDSLTDSNEWAESFPEVEIYNRGIINDTTNGVLDRIESLVSSEPGKIFIMIGTNDLGAAKSVNDTLKMYEKIISEINKRSPDTEVIIQSTLPVNEKMIKSERNDNIKELNSKLRTYAEQKSITYVDIFSVVVDAEGQLNSDLTHDGVHLNDEGYNLWEEKIQSYIK